MVVQTNRSVSFPICRRAVFHMTQLVFLHELDHFFIQRRNSHRKIEIRTEIDEINCLFSVVVLVIDALL